MADHFDYHHVISIFVISNEKRSGVSRSSSIFTIRGIAVSLSSLEKGSLSSANILGFTLPRLEDGGLESSSI